MPVQTEAQFQEAVVAYAQLKGWLVHHDRPAAGRKGEWRTHISGNAGFPDLVLAKEGRVIFAELKRSRKQKATEAQWDWLNNLPDTDTYLWTPDDWNFIEDTLT